MKSKRHRELGKVIMRSALLGGVLLGLTLQSYAAGGGKHPGAPAPEQTNAEESQPAQGLWGLPIYLNLNASLGFGSASVLNNSSPSMLYYETGAVAAWRFMNIWLAGFSTNVDFLNQLTTVSSTSGVNYKGHRWNILSPTLGWQDHKITALADFQFLGNYSYSQTTVSGTNVSNSGPLGFRLRGSYNLFQDSAGFLSKCDIGLQFTYLTFGTYNDSSGGSQDLTTRQKFWNVGPTLSYSF